MIKKKNFRKKEKERDKKDMTSNDEVLSERHYTNDFLEKHGKKKIINKLPFKKDKI